MERNGPGTQDGADGLRTLAIALETVKSLQRMNGATVTELQQRMNLSKSAIYNHLNTLQEHGFVVKNGETYELGLMFILLGEFVREENDLYSVGRDPIEALAEAIGYTAHLVTEQHHNRIELTVARGDKAVGRRFSSVYDPLDFHTSASGKVMLSFVDDETREAILAKHGLPERTSNTITDRETLEDELETVREQGYAINDEEEMGGLRGLAAPIKGQDDTVEGAVSISAPVGSVSEEQLHNEIAEQVIQTANVIQLDLNMERRRDT